MITTAKPLSLEEKKQILKKDFLDRDQTTFVKIRRNGRLGWETLIPEGKPISDYLITETNEREIISTAYRLAKDMILVMDLPVKTDIRISPDKSKTDGRNIWVATEVFDDKEMPAGARIDTFIGLAVHEGCHILYTDFEANKGVKNRVIRMLANLLEDERIERLLGEDKPGLANFITAAKYYYFDRYQQTVSQVRSDDSEQRFIRLFNSIISLVRYPKAMQKSELNEFADTLLDVRTVISDYPESTAQSLVCAYRIYDIIKDQLDKEDLDEQEDGSQASQDGSAGSKETENLIQRTFEKIEQACENITGEPTKDSLKQESVASLVKENNCLLGKICEGIAENGSQKSCVVIKGEPNADSYMTSYQRIRRYIPALSKTLKNNSQEYKVIHKGMRSGFLDAGKIAEAYQGVPTVYQREGQVKSDRIAVCILLDESGSMMGKPERAARDTAVLLNEALGTLTNVDLYIYGHSTEVGTALYVYREKSYKPKYALGGTSSRWGNNDGTAIREAAHRVRRHTKEQCLFFMISDGAPNETVETVKKAVDNVEKQGFSIMAVSIDPSYDPSLMYQRNINFKNLSNLAIDLGKVIKNTIEKKTNRKIL